MDFSTYQKLASKTDRVVDEGDKSKLVPLLGLAGEVGTLLSEYKKYLRDGTAHQRFECQVAEDLGDLLWYIANVATKFDVDLGEIAANNLTKVRDRWPSEAGSLQGSLFDVSRVQHFDGGFPASEQIPRKFEVTFREVLDGASARVLIARDGEQIGDALTDNAIDDDGYRFHDVFHLAYAATLGWSPIIRKLLGVKRKSNPQIDEIEDGARARIVEELISQLVFGYATEHNLLEGVISLDYHLLKTIRSLVDGREVGACALHQWEAAILSGYRVWRSIYRQRGGTVRVDLNTRSIAHVDESVSPPSHCAG